MSRFLHQLWSGLALVTVCAVLSAASIAVAQDPVSEPVQPASASPAVMTVGGFSTIDDGAGVERILSGEYDDQFLPERGPIRLRGGANYTHWLRLVPNASLLGDGETWRLRMERLPLDRMTLYVPREGQRPESRHLAFFYPTEDDGVLSNGFVYDLPSPLPAAMYLAISTRVDLSLQPELLRDASYQSSSRKLASLYGAVYAAIIVLTLSSLALFLALRERAYLYFVGVSASLILLLAALNGHVYAVTGLNLLAWIGPSGIAGLMLLFAALALLFVRYFVKLSEHAASFDTVLRYTTWALLLATALCLLNINALQSMLFSLGTIAWPLSALAAMVASTVAWRANQRGALSFALIWLVVAAASGLRVAIMNGWLAAASSNMIGSQMLLAAAIFLLSIVLADRVMEFRQRHEQAQQVTERSTADLQIEQRRRELVEGLQDALRGAPNGDLQWIAFRRLLASLAPLVPNKAVSLVAFGYHQLDLLLVEPGQHSERIKQLLRERGGNIKGICRGRTSMQLYFTPADKVIVEPGQPEPENPICGRFAVVPLEISKPGWGGVIIESADDKPLSKVDLQRVAELATIALEITDESVSQLDLRRRAEIDSLTGAFNRRAGESALEEIFQRAQQGRIPLSVLFIDLDHFKRINDEYGHPIGDECLRLLAECLRRQLRNEDVVSRYGGEEFMVMLPGQTQDQARKIGERIREAVAALRVRHEGGMVKFTVSIGVATRSGSENQASEILERADHAMYQAKRNGRNRVQIAGGYTPGANDDFNADDLIL